MDLVTTVIALVAASPQLVWITLTAVPTTLMETTITKIIRIKTLKFGGTLSVIALTEEAITIATRITTETTMDMTTTETPTTTLVPTALKTALKFALDYSRTGNAHPPFQLLPTKRSPGTPFLIQSNP
jgi:hypothetical protein